MSVTHIVLIAEDTCKRCGGECCKVVPGCCVPSDFGHGKVSDEEFKNRVIAALRSGKYAVDCWDGDPREKLDGVEGVDDYWVEEAYFIRPAIVGERGLFVKSWGGTCNFWNRENGCSLNFHDRPLGCRSLEPKKTDDGECIPHAAGKREAAILWLPFTEILDSIVWE